MADQERATGVKTLVVVTYVLMVTVNALANTLPINGVPTGEVSDKYGNLFAPAGYAFAIWGLIYLLVAGYAIYQTGAFRSTAAPGQEGLLRRVGILFAVSSVANAAWIFAWHYDAILLSMLFMLVILVSLIAIALRLRGQGLTGRDYVFLRLPFSVYLGWITVATIANATVLLVSVGWDGFGISEPVWTVLVLLVGLVIAAATLWRLRDLAYGLTVVWAYTGVLVKHLSAAGFSGQYPAVIATVAVCILLLIAVGVYMVTSGRRAAPAQ